MRNLGETIRAIRKGLGLTTVQFGERIGVDNSAVSRYERDKQSPSAEVLLVLYGLAADREAQGRIRQAIGVKVSRLPEQGVVDLLTDLERHPEGFTEIAVVQSALHRYARSKGRSRFLEEARKLLTSGLEIDAAVSRIIRVYREHGQSPKVHALFRKALGYLEVEMGESADLTAGARRQKRDRGKHQA